MLRLMYRFGRPAMALGLALLLLQGADAQPGKGKRKGGDDAAPKAEAQASPELQTWIKTLTEKMTDRQDSIRDSARAALVSIGRPALPELQKLADGRDGASAEAAKQVIAHIERGGAGGAGGGGRGGVGGGGGIPGGPGGGGGAFPGGGGRGFGGGFGIGPNRALTQALKDLDLSEKQQARVEKIMTAQQDKTRELMEKLRDGKLNPEDMRTAMEKAQDDLLKDIKDVLTKEQSDKLDKALKDAERGGGRGGFGGGRGGPGGGGPGGGRPGRQID